MLESGDTPGCSKTEKSLCLATPAQHFFLLWDFLLGIFRATRKKGAPDGISCVLQTILDGWSFLSLGNLFRARPFSRKSPAPHWGRMNLTFMMGLRLRPWKFFLGGNDRYTLIWNAYFPPRRCPPIHHRSPIHLGVRTIRLANDVLHQAGIRKPHKKRRWLKMNNSRDWWVDTGLFLLESWRYISNNRRTYCNKNPPWNLTSSPKKTLKTMVVDLESRIPFWKSFLGAKIGPIF